MKITKKTAALAKKNGVSERIYADAVNSLIRERYSLSDELALLRQRDVKSEEFKAYNDYAVECKAAAREALEAAEDELER